SCTSLSMSSAPAALLSSLLLARSFLEISIWCGLRLGFGDSGEAAREPHPLRGAGPGTLRVFLFVGARQECAPYCPSHSSTLPAPAARATRTPAARTPL